MILYIPLFRTLPVQETEKKCIQNDESMYDVETTCNTDDNEKSPPLNDFKHSGMIKYRIFALLSACAYIPRGRKPALNSEVCLTSRCV